MEQFPKPKSGGKGKDKPQKSTGAEANASRSSGEDYATRDIYSTVSHMERTLFVVDLSKLEDEGDTLVGALVLYQPQHELKRGRYEQRCSQVIGISLCMKNLTSKYPKYVHLKGCGFAIRSLGGVYIMGLSSRLEEPSSCVVSLMEFIHNIFQFYYHSPSHVLQNCHGQWNDFITTMERIFSNITDYVSRDKHSVPAMFRPLPYVDSNSYKMNRQELYLLSSRVLRACQNLSPIIGGCIVHNSKLVFSQFPSSLTEVLILVGTGKVDLNHKSILEDQIVPDKVWVLEVYLTREQERLAIHQRTNLSAFQESYAAMNSNPQFTSSTLHWRFQSSLSTVPSLDNGKNHATSWARKSKKLSSTSTPVSSLPLRQAKQRRSPRSPMKLASNLPQLPSRHSSDNGSLLSEDAVMLSPGMVSVSFNNEHIKIKRKAELYRTQHNRSKLPPAQQESLNTERVGSNATLNEADDHDLYLDAVDVDPEMAIGPEMLRLFSQSSSSSHSKGGGNEGITGKEMRDNGHEIRDEKSVGIGFTRPVVEVEGRVVHGTGSTSSEGFATPSPTPPKHTSIMPGHLLRDDSVGPDVTCSFKTANESFICGTDEEGGGEGTKEDRRDANSSVQASFLSPPSSNRLAIRTRGGPPVERANISKSTDVTEQQLSSDEDFLDSIDIDRLLQIAHTENKTLTSNCAGVNNLHVPLSETSPVPPPVPERHSATTNIIQDLTLATDIADDEEVPPIPPPHKHSTMQPPPEATESCSRQDLPSLTISPEESHSLPENDKKEETIVEEDGEEPSPPLPPRLPSSEEVLMSGRLDTPVEFPYLPKMASSPNDTAEKKPAYDDGVPNMEPSVAPSSWIYNSFEEMLKGFGGDKEEEGKEEDVKTGPNNGDTIRNLEEGGLNLPGGSPIVKNLESNDGVHTASKACHVKNNSEKDDSENNSKLVEENVVIGDSSFQSDKSVPSVHQFADGDYEEIDDLLPVSIGRRMKGTVTESESSETLIAADAEGQFADRDYEEIEDNLLINIGRRTKGTVTEPESSETVIAAGAESKTSSMTVTLDLSHIAKDDILYGGNGGEKRLSNCSSSVDISLVSQTPIDVNGNESPEETGKDGMMTPVEITYNDSMFNLVKEKHKGQKKVGLVVDAAAKEAMGGKVRETEVCEDYDNEFDDTRSNDSAEYSSFPEEDERLLGKYVGTSPRLSEVRKRSRTWLSHSMDKPNVDSEEVEQTMEKFSVYVQCYMETYIILLADAGLHRHKHRGALNELWRSLSEQLLSLELVLEVKKESMEPCTLNAYVTTFSSKEKLCQAQPNAAAYHFRHAVRRAHQEYIGDPSLRQLSLSKEHCRMLSQNIHGREVYVQPAGHAGDALTLHGIIEKHVKDKISIRQQPLGGPKVMLV